jgi:hypothetical protein
MSGVGRRAGGDGGIGGIVGRAPDPSGAVGRDACVGGDDPAVGGVADAIVGGVLAAGRGGKTGRGGAGV